MEILVILGIIGTIILITWLDRRLSNLRDKARKYVQLKPKLDDLNNYSEELNKRNRQLVTKESFLHAKQMEWLEKVERDKKELSQTKLADINTIETLSKEKSVGFPWLAEAYSDYYHLRDLQKAEYLEIKNHPGLKSAEQVREIASKRRDAEKLYRILKYKLQYYENLFPWLIDFTGEDIDELIQQIVEKKQSPENDEQEPDDPVKKWLTEAEYKNLSTIEKNQRALNRYWKRGRSKWSIGRDYERYIGYLYESNSYSVYYQGIVEGLSDLGRDLICTKKRNIEIVQCKRWAREKQIHEKHIFQLYGTVVAYNIDHPGSQALSCFVTTTSLSQRAKEFAKELKIKVQENYSFDENYPCIKCNISKKDGGKIYHLPFDQQYDKTIIEQETNERYVQTVKEAESLGFRRAFRWHGSITNHRLI